MKKKKSKGREGVGGERGLERKIILFFSSFRFFLRSMKIGLQVFIGTEGKVDLPTKATLGYQNLGVSSNSTR